VKNLVDPRPGSRVLTVMRPFRPLGRLALVLGLAAGLTSTMACGGSKKGKTTPAAGDKTGDGKGSGDDGTGTGGGSGSGDGDPTLPGGGGGDGGSGDGDGDGDGVDVVKAPGAIVPPNLDISPDQARNEVQKRLANARTMLSATPPDSDGAIREARATLAADGTNIDAIVVIAHANYYKRLYDTAEVILDDLFKNRSTSQSNPYLYYVYGLVYDALAEKQKAFVAYRKATELDPAYSAALVNLGVHQLANKQYDDAVATYERLTNQIGRNDAPTWNGLGASYRGKSADFESTSPERATWLLKAEAAFKRAQTLNRNYGQAYYNLGLLYLDADPFPGPNGQPVDTLVRLNQAKTYFDEYKNLPGVDMALYDERAKDVTKLIKREEKKRKKAAGDAQAAGGGASGGTTTGGGEPQ
jgi:tetratricopeptide (TPR) repeat protein